MNRARLTFFTLSGLLAASGVLMFAQPIAAGGLVDIGGQALQRVLASKWLAAPAGGNPWWAATTAGKPREVVLRELIEENEWKNDLLLFWMPQAWREPLPRFVQTWMRNYIASIAIYFSVSGLWAYYVYVCFGDRLYKPGETPRGRDMLEQIKVSSIALPLYSMLPAVNEWLAEHGYLKVYARISDVGLAKYAGLFLVYMLLVEFGVYWAHRGLHELRLGMRYIHHTHHTYNKENQMSPFAGLAFNPFDGITQASPYTLAMLLVPMHFMTHELMLFFTAVWTTNIHDNLHANVMPIMGAGYHTIHHTTYRHNYGQFFVLMDWLHGTLVTPEAYEAERAAARAKRAA